MIYEIKTLCARVRGAAAPRRGSHGPPRVLSSVLDNCVGQSDLIALLPARPRSQGRWQLFCLDTVEPIVRTAQDELNTL